MKKFVCLSVLLSLIVSIAYSQSINKFKLDSFSLKIPDRITEMPFSFKSNDCRNLLKDGNNYLFPKTFPSPMVIKEKTLGSISKAPFDNMPLIKPEGNFHMRILKPDTTVRYSMQIKDVPLRGFGKVRK